MKAQEGEQQAGNINMQEPEVFPTLLSNHVQGTHNEHAEIALQRAASTAQRKMLCISHLARESRASVANLYLEQRVDVQLHAGQT